MFREQRNKTFLKDKKDNIKFRIFFTAEEHEIFTSPEFGGFTNAEE